MLGQQISGKPIDYAILQMQFSEKRASSRIMNMLVTAKDHARRYKQLKEPKLIVGKHLRPHFQKKNTTTYVLVG
jgi:large subunit ribosomal protein L22